MTSSYNLSRRPKQRYTEWESYARNQGICPVGFDTYLYGNHDWRICVPNPHPPTSENDCRCDPQGACECGERQGGWWQNGSSNPYAKDCPEPKSGWRTSRATLYNDNDKPSWMYNTIPYTMRRQLHEPRAMFDRYRYFQLPTRYAGTGYEVLRGWKTPQYAEDMIDVPPVWDETRPWSAQPYPIQQQSYEAQENNWTTLTTRNDGSKLGAFYSDPVDMRTQGSG